jgi:type IV pilus assembly protein PilE
MRILQKGFTLIELMIVVAIVSILAAIAYPAYTDQIRKGRRAECRSGLLQSMQQQERFYSQYNTYAAFTSGQTDAKTKSFSGDNLANSACKIAATTCTAGAINQCVELQASMNNTSDPVKMLYLTSGGDKGCTFKSSTRVTNEKQCWP